MRTIKKTHRKINLLNKTSLTNCRSNKKTLCKKASIEKNQKQRYIIVTVGPTGSGKTDMIHKLEKYLAATTEVCSLYVDLDTRRVTEFEDSKRKLINEFIDNHKDQFNPGDLHLVGKLKK